MAFCMSCGAKVKDGANFCLSCGKPVGSAAPEAATPKSSSKEGEVLKCPQCGEVVNAFDLKCASCGHEFRNRSAAKSTMSFFEDYKQTPLESRAAIVRAFPVPNAREDILSFLTLSIGNTKSLTIAEKQTYRIGNEYTSQLMYREEEIAAWQSKVEQVISIGKIILTDAADKTLLQNFVRQLAQNSKIGAKSRAKKALLITILAAILIGSGSYGLYAAFAGTTVVPATVTVSAKDIEVTGNLAKFLKVVEKDYVIRSDMISPKAGLLSMTIQFEVIGNFQAGVETKYEEVIKRKGWSRAESYISAPHASFTLSGIDKNGIKVVTLDCWGTSDLRTNSNFSELQNSKKGDILAFNFIYGTYPKEKLPVIKKTLAKGMTMQTFKIDASAYFDISGHLPNDNYAGREYNIVF